MNVKLTSRLTVLLTIGAIAAFCCMVNISVSSEIYIPTVDNKMLNTSTISGKIYINNNWTDAKAAGICTGEGTASDPYVIKDLEINGGGTGSCILIENSSVFFRIENCTVYNSGPSCFDGGIELSNVKYGQIINNEAYGQTNGIFINGSSGSIVSGNDCYLSTGILIEYSENITVYFNNFVGNTEFASDFSFYNSTVYWSSAQKLSYKYNGITHTNYIGNYFQNYVGQDANNDGIGDNPHVIDTHKPTPIIVDVYPLMEPIENYEITNAIDLIPGYNPLIIIGLLSFPLILSIRKFKKLLN
ncbi:MAG: hypothetical protein KGD74_01355 [Candidatus Lokiarchaeota archaeon]|nr:hypothetical protein [Candidatus Lokiarchaeota archaeon]